MTLRIVNSNPGPLLVWGEVETTMWDAPPKPCVLFTLTLLRPGRPDLPLGASSGASIVWDVPPVSGTSCRLHLDAMTSEGEHFTDETPTDHAFEIGPTPGPPGATGPQGATGVQGPPGPGLPSGTIVAYGGTASPPGWLACDGAKIPRTTYATLYAAIGNTWGAGDGVTTFQLPDLRGYFLRGADEQAIRDLDAAARRDIDNKPRLGVGSMQTWATGMPRAPFAVQPVADHQHGDPTTDGQAGPYELAVGLRGPSGYDYGAQSAPTTAAGGHGHGLTGGDRETRPLNVAVLYIIKI